MLVVDDTSALARELSIVTVRVKDVQDRVCFCFIYTRCFLQQYMQESVLLQTCAHSFARACLLSLELGLAEPATFTLNINGKAKACCLCWRAKG